MTIAYSCVLIAILLPLVWAMYAKQPYLSNKSYDNHSPRPLLQQLEGRYQRANWAQQNAFEALPGIIAAIIIAHLTGVTQSTIDTLAVVCIIARIAHGVFYITDWATARSAAWAVALACIIGLFITGFN